ncbi:TPA: DEAD/DEAH box helicase family protein [Escherichia coli]|nr:DEAD/DEAH box helicase family protein [Salmonella enterica]HDV1797788.1 DEAD/DEAH box helicase family protein [Escherichia coli]
MEKTTVINRPDLPFYTINSDGLHLSEYSTTISSYYNSHYLTYIEAPTGVGKTTYITKCVTSVRTPVVLLLPTVAQVVQMESLLKNSQFRACFASGGNGIDTEAILIVATYDKLPLLLSKPMAKKIKKAILVIDECHKIYTAGDYRPKAVQTIIDCIKGRKFKKVIGLSATYNNDAITIFSRKCLKLTVDDWCKIQFITPDISRACTICRYPDGLSKTLFSNLKNIHDKYKKLMMVRLNNKKELELLSEYLILNGKQVISVYQERQRDICVIDMLKNQKVPLGIDFLLTTSLLDEGINLNNEEVHSVHMVGMDAHVDEMAQCIGRFRKTIPEVWYHLGPDIADDKDSDIFCWEDEVGDSTTFLNDLLHMLQRYRYWRGRSDAQVVKELNAMAKTLSMGNPYYLDDEMKLCLSEGAAYAHTFKLEKKHQYRTTASLCAAIGKRFPQWKFKKISPSVTLEKINKEPLVELAASKRKGVIEEIKSRLVKILPKEYRRGLHDWDAPREVVAEAFNTLCEDMENNKTVLAATIKTAEYLSHAVLDDPSMKKIFYVLEEDKVSHVLTFHEMLNNPLYRSLYKRLAVKAVDGWARVKRNAAPGIVGQALLRASRDTGMESYLKKICSPTCYQMLRSKGQVTANMAARMLQKIGKRKDTDGYFHVQIDAPFGLKFRTFEYYFGEQTSGLNPWGSLDACEFDETDIIHMSKSVTGKQCGPGSHTSLRAKRLTLSQVMGDED